MRLWNNIRDLTLVSSAPAMIYEEGDLVKRAVRDIYASEIEEILVSGNDGQTGKDFMKLLMPTSVKKNQTIQGRQNSFVPSLSS